MKDWTVLCFQINKIPQLGERKKIGKTKIQYYFILPHLKITSNFGNNDCFYLKSLGGSNLRCEQFEKAFTLAHKFRRSNLQQLLVEVSLQQERQQQKKTELFSNKNFRKRNFMYFCYLKFASYSA